jgi:hypothetical protein
MALSILDGNQSATTLSTILSSGQHITAHTVVSLGTQAITDMRGAVSGSVVSISNLPATQTIAGTVTANGGDFTGIVDLYAPPRAINIGFYDGQYTANFVHVNNDDIANHFPVKVGSMPAISGTVTIGSALPAGTNRIGVVTIGGGTVTIGAGTAQIGSVTASISGTVPISISSVTVGNSVTIGSLPAISGTVTANSSNGSLTTRFGSVTTANTAFATSAVTNANRKYLLIQNVTTASNVITVGIGFTPTTTQGIQLSSGAGLTFESSYIPTGAVNLLSSVTASCFTILEA